jgi:hypothetical protein
VPPDFRSREVRAATCSLSLPEAVVALTYGAYDVPAVRSGTFGAASEVQPKPEEQPAAARVNRQASPAPAGFGRLLIRHAPALVASVRGPGQIGVPGRRHPTSGWARAVVREKPRLLP